MKRRECRERALELIFEGDYCAFEEPENIYARALEVRGFEDDEYVKKLFFGVAEKHVELDEIISDNLKGWKRERISRPVLAVLRLAVYEMTYCGIAVGIVINEALELAREYDVDSSPAFVNGVLNAAAEQKGLKA